MEKGLEIPKRVSSGKASGMPSAEVWKPRGAHTEDWHGQIPAGGGQSCGVDCTPASPDSDG